MIDLAREPDEARPNPDICVRRCVPPTRRRVRKDAVWYFQPATPEGQEWVNGHIAPDRLRPENLVGRSFVVPEAEVDDLVAVMRGEGLVVYGIGVDLEGDGS